jgi:pyruvate-ferredoxin/flavodoxin oxidoreductase
MLQSKAGIENKEYNAQRSVLADVDAGKIAKEELFARGEQLLRERLQPTGPAQPGGHTPRTALAAS